jgi:hypothetical protein
MDKDARTMTTDLTIAARAGALSTGGSFVLPAVIADQGNKAAERFLGKRTGLSTPEGWNTLAEPLTGIREGKASD